MGLDNISQTNYISQVAQQVAQKHTSPAATTPETKPDTVELSTKAAAEESNGLKQILIAAGTIAVLVGGFFVAKRFLRTNNATSSSNTPEPVKKVVEKLFKTSDDKIVEGVKLGKGINGKATLPDGSLFTGTLEKTDKSGRMVVSYYKDGLVDSKRIISLDGNEAARKYIDRHEGNFIRTWNKTANSDKQFIKEMHYHDNGKLKYMRYGENPSSESCAKIAKFIGFDDKGTLVLKGARNLGSKGQIDFYDASGKITRSMKLEPNVDGNVFKGLKCGEFVYDANGNIIKKSVAKDLGNLQSHFTSYADANTGIRDGVKYVEFPQKFGEAKIKPAYKSAGISIEYPDGSDVHCSISYGYHGRSPMFCNIEKCVPQPNNQKAIHKYWDIPLSPDKQNTIEYNGDIAEVSGELKSLLQKIKEVASELKDNKNFTLQSGKYNILDVINSSLAAMSRK